MGRHLTTPDPVGHPRLRGGVAMKGCECPWCQHIRKRMRDYRQANRETIAARMRDYRKANRERIAARNRDYRKANPEKVSARNRDYRVANRDKDRARRYGLSVEQLDALSPVCAICGGDGTTQKLALGVDHDHSCCPGTGSCGECVRDRLCLKCNTGLGYFEDDIEKLRSAISYLERWSK